MAAIEAIATTYLEADAATVTFSSIPATYEHLQLRINAKTDYTNVSTASYGAIRFNGDTASVYGRHFIEANGSSVSADAQVANSEMYLCRFASAVVAPSYGALVWDILDYANTNKNTTCQASSGVVSDASLHVFQFGSGYWDNTAVVHTILIDQSGGSNFVRGSEFTLYGLNSA